MHPAPSVIVFTSLSGLGFGLLIFLGLGKPEVEGLTAFAFYALAFGLAVGGLISSTFHLGNPQRALKAFSQWRSSWLSREGVSAVASLSVMGLYAALHLFMDLKLPVLGAIGAFLCFVSVYCTAMIYAQLKTVPRWNQQITPYLFLVFALAGGAMLAAQFKMVPLLLAGLLLLQVLYWVLGDQRFGQSGSTIETATGLGHLGKVRLLESPHSGDNYLTKEMVHIIGRKHSIKLRIVAALLIAVIPLILWLIMPLGHLSAGLMIISHVIGLFVSRWLFFAEAEHVVGLYYDKH